MFGQVPILRRMHMTDGVPLDGIYLSCYDSSYTVTHHSNSRFPSHQQSFAMKLTSTTTTTLLPFAPHQQMIPSSNSSQRSSARSSVHTRVPIISSILYSMPSSASRLRGLFDTPRRPNTLRIRPSTISETSYESSCSSASSSSSSFPNPSPTSCSTSLPPSPP